MFCLKCRYPLHGLTEHECPECGSPFEPSDPATFLRSTQRVHPISVVIGLCLTAGTLLWGLEALFAVELLDAPSAIWVLGLMTGGLWTCFGPKIVFDAFGAACGRRGTRRETWTCHHLVFFRAYQLGWSIGLLGTLLGVISIFFNMDDPSKVGPGVGVSLLPLLYGGLLSEFVFAPLLHLVAVRSQLEMQAAFIAATSRPMMERALSVVSLVVVIILVVVLAWSGTS
jgi:hypothetical protein